VAGTGACLISASPDRPAQPVAEPVVAAISRRLVGCPPDGLCVLRSRRQPRHARGVRSRLSIGNYRRVYKRTAALAGLDGLDVHGPHDLRHTYATWLEDGAIPSRASTS
jgi:integrase